MTHRLVTREPGDGLAGYVTFRLLAHTSATSQDQPHGTTYTANREQVMADLAATMAWLSEDRR